jgi:two-component system, OmpR family, alkaline phosphatase synthesis response regulator PhoP
LGDSPQLGGLMLNKIMVLVVEDDEDIATLLIQSLKQAGLEVLHAANCAQARRYVEQFQFALVTLDLSLPDGDGLDLCRLVKEIAPEIAILMVSARHSETDRVVGLELGADDYMIKPFSVREFQARVRSLLRRVQLLADARSHPPSELLQFGALVIDKPQHRVTLKGATLDLTATEFDLLEFLVQQPRRVFSRSQLLSSVWGYQHSGYEHTVNSHINRLRSKIEKNPNQPKIVETVWGVGYRFNPESVL